MKVLTAAQMREVDRRTTEEFGVPSLQLMENAATRVVEFLKEQYGDLGDKRIVVLCGKGNNGGDGLVVARLLKAARANPRVFLFAAPDAVRGDAAINLQRWREAGGDLRVVADDAAWQHARHEVAGADIILDALLGTGLTGAVAGLLAQVIEDVNRLRARCQIVAVDIPSGLPSDGPALAPAGAGPAAAGAAVIIADHTVTFTAPKLGQLLEPNFVRVGKLHVGQIGTPPQILAEDSTMKTHMLEPGEFREIPLERRPDSHKGDYGHALIVAGSRGKTGAAALAAWGALRVGVGLVTVATAESVLPTVAAMLPEMMTEPLPGTDAESISLRSLDYGRFETVTREKNVLALGPGLSTHNETQQFVRAVVAECPLPLILDADGLNAFAGRAEELRKRKTSFLSITPHPGEMARLLGCTAKDVQARRVECAVETAARWNAYVVLKGARTVVATPDGRCFINSTGNAGMATAGVGDVLTGMLAGLTAQFGPSASLRAGTRDWEKVLGFGVYLHGLAGDIAAAEIGQAPLMASDLVQAIPRAYRQAAAEIQKS